MSHILLWAGCDVIWLRAVAWKSGWNEAMSMLMCHCSTVSLPVYMYIILDRIVWSGVSRLPGKINTKPLTITTTTTTTDDHCVALFPSALYTSYAPYDECLLRFHSWFKLDKIILWHVNICISFSELQIEFRK